MQSTTCPVCFEDRVYYLPGGEFQGCHGCHVIAARDRRTTTVYDQAYVAERYDRYPTNIPMSRLRLRWLNTILFLHENLPQADLGPVRRGRLLDVGYGNGEFIRTALRDGWDAYGNDVNPTSYEGVRPVSLPDGVIPGLHPHYRAVTFFDCLEHFEDLYSVRWVSHQADWIFLSFPKVPAFFPEMKAAPGEPPWRHYRPGEHHFYFQPETVARAFSHHGRRAVVAYVGSPEDAIRGRLPYGANILSVALQCHDESSG